MGLAAIIVGVLSLVFLALGLFLWVIPVLGPLVTFGAPILGIAAIILGGVAMSRAKQDGESSSAGIAGLVMGIIGTLFGIIEALTCGICSALCTTAAFMPIPDGGPYRQQQWQWAVDAGPGAMPGAFPGWPPQPGQPVPPGALPDPSGGSGVAPALPPPPINPGPTTGVPAAPGGPSAEPPVAPGTPTGPP